MSNEVKLGELLNETAQRDAIHIAIMPVIAAENLVPGQRVSILHDRAYGNNLHPIGIVDPFLKGNVKRNARFYMFLLPNTITSLRHEWTHPAIDAEKIVADQRKQMAIEWLTVFADEFNLTYAQLVASATAFVETGKYHHLNFDTPDIAYKKVDDMWNHLEIAAGLKKPDGEYATFFNCAC